MVRKVSICAFLQIHIAHFNIKYGTFEEAMKHPDGLAIVAVFLNVSPLYLDPNTTLGRLFVLGIARRQPIARTIGSCYEQNPVQRRYVRAASGL